jgi:hypothetical protein
MLFGWLQKTYPYAILPNALCIPYEGLAMVGVTISIQEFLDAVVNFLSLNVFFGGL